MLRFIYSLLFISLLPLICLRLYWRSRKAPDYRQRILERFGFYSQKFNKGGICLHAVSVGELMAAKPLIAQLKAQYPDLPLTITTTTPTASRLVKLIFTNTVQHVYIPYDYPGAIKRFLRAFRPQFVIIMETEIWPNLFYMLKQHQIPLFIANARLAEKSLRGYQKIKFFISPILQCVDCIAAQSAIDAQHFEQLGIMQNKIVVCGNLKYDVVVEQSLVEKGHALRSQWGQRLVWIASSTHEAEEAFIIETAIAVKKQQPNALCIIAPRHPERFNALAAMAVEKKLNVSRYSQQQVVTENTDIFLADTLGELFFFYALADVALVCGSFAPIGGHNILEPASLGLPIIVGPQMFHFKTILADFLQIDAIKQVQDEDSLLPMLLKLLTDKTTAQQMGVRAHDLVLNNQGAVDKIIQLLPTAIH